VKKRLEEEERKRGREEERKRGREEGRGNAEDTGDRQKIEVEKEREVKKMRKQLCERLHFRKTTKTTKQYSTSNQSRRPNWSFEPTKWW
jgi:hypothetical protein